MNTICCIKNQMVFLVNLQCILNFKIQFCVYCCCGWPNETFTLFIVSYPLLQIVLNGVFSDLNFISNKRHFSKETLKPAVRAESKQRPLTPRRLPQLRGDRRAGRCRQVAAPSAGRWPGLQLCLRAPRPGLQPWPLTPARFSPGPTLTDTPTEVREGSLGQVPLWFSRRWSDLRCVIKHNHPRFTEWPDKVRF